MLGRADAGAGAIEAARIGQDRASTGRSRDHVREFDDALAMERQGPVHARISRAPAVRPVASGGSRPSAQRKPFSVPTSGKWPWIGSPSRLGAAYGGGDALAGVRAAGHAISLGECDPEAAAVMEAAAALTRTLGGRQPPAGTGHHPGRTNVEA
ncbi:hypothetical protein [Pseudoroseomonas sp. WGS1072]|uniref:hypothetical protein n=1 Tax=Roseomonas sp. WGS1072 TaxID=3366816 RepID=UPI003BF3BA6A